MHQKLKKRYSGFSAVFQIIYSILVKTARSASKMPDAFFGLKTKPKIISLIEIPKLTD